MSDQYVLQKAQQVCRLLISIYGSAVSERKLPPVDELVLTILSQNTADVNAERAFAALKAKYDDWESVLHAPADELGRVIRPSGFFRLKAQRIQATLAEIQTRTGQISLSLLADMPTDEAKHWLMSLPGVGPKTASIVLLFSFGRPTLPVDTHVWRVTRRLGLVPSKASRESAQTVLERLLPAICIPSANRNLIRLGREICKARRPRCDRCFLRDLCDYYALSPLMNS
ncbi:MAG: endonuclease III [Candidatus Thorarchaeota archaeon]|nr:endonuclease III [Candidatus Thorarchaeota archaeon]